MARKKIIRPDFKTADGIKFWQKALGLTNKQASELLQVPSRTYDRWKKQGLPKSSYVVSIIWDRMNKTWKEKLFK